METAHLGEELRTAEQRANYQADLVAASKRPRFWGAIKEMQLAAQKKALEPLRDETLRARREHLKLHKKLSGAGRMTPGEVERYSALIARFGTPSKSDVHIDAALTTLLSTFGQGNLIADMLLPPYAVPKRSGKVFQDRQEDIQVGDEGSLKVPGGPSHETDWGMNTPVAYSIEDYGRKKTVPDVIASEADDPINVREKTAASVQRRILMEREIRVVTLVTTAGNYPAGNQIPAATTKWDAAGGPASTEDLDDIEAAWKAVADTVGEGPNLVAMNKSHAWAVIRKDYFRESIKYTRSALAEESMALIADYFQVRDVYISLARKATANPGQTATFGDVWPDQVVMLFNEAPGTLYRGWGLSPATDVGTARGWRHPDVDRDSDVVEFKQSIDEKKMQGGAGAILQDVLE